jgi:small-conductance mechanosensitive channel
MPDSLITAPPLILPTQDPSLLAIKAVIIFLGVLILGFVVRFIGIRWIEKLSKQTKTRIDDILVRSIKGPVVLWFLVLGLDLASKQVVFNLAVRFWIDRASIIIGVISLTWAVARFTSGVINEYGTRLGGAMPVTSLTRNFTRIVIYIIGLLFIFQTLSVSITPLLTALGVGGLAVALALQTTLSDLFSGMCLEMAKQVRVGDYVKLDSGFEGYVTDITWRTTTIKSLANNNILVPNVKMAQAIITNYHTPETRMMVTQTVNVPYASDPGRIEKILIEEALKVADELPGLLKDPAPSVSLTPGFGEYALNFSLFYHVKQFVDQYPVQNALRRRLLKRFQEEGIELPTPQRQITITSGEIPTRNQ